MVELIASLVPVVLTTIAATKLVKNGIEGLRSIVAGRLAKLPAWATTGIAIAVASLHYVVTGDVSVIPDVSSGVLAGLVSSALVWAFNRFGGKAGEAPAGT